MISSQQTAYVKNRFTEDSGRLISGMTESSIWLNITSFLVTMDIEKAFDSLDHGFLISILKKFVLEKFLYCIKINNRVSDNF